MIQDYFREYGLVAIFFLVSISVPVGMLLASYLTSLIRVRPRRPTPEKLGTYECGFDPVGGRWAFNFHFYGFALLFVLFDVETVFLYPWAIRFGVLTVRFGSFALIEVLAFVAILVLGLAYAWRKHALEWS